MRDVLEAYAALVTALVVLLYARVRELARERDAARVVVERMRRQLAGEDPTRVHREKVE